MSAAVRILPHPLHGSGITPADYPEGVWRVPTALVIDQTTSAHATLIRRRMAANDQPEPTATVFQHMGRLFAVVDWPQAGHTSSLFPLDLAWQVPPPFGRREKG